jgi:hypothetical protein
MSTPKATTDNLSGVLDTLAAEVGRDIDRDQLSAYLTQLDNISATIKAIREPHKKAVAVLASQKSRARRGERVAKALALLVAQEKAEAKS